MLQKLRGIAERALPRGQELDLTIIGIDSYCPVSIRGRKPFHWGGIPPRIFILGHAPLDGVTLCVRTQAWYRRTCLHPPDGMSGAASAPPAPGALRPHYLCLGEVTFNTLKTESDGSLSIKQPQIN